MLRKTLFICASFYAAWAVSNPIILSAEETQAAWGPTSIPAPIAAPERLVEKSGVAPAAMLEVADEAMVQPITAWNLAGNLPRRNGIERPLPKVMSVVLPNKAPGTKLEQLAGGVLGRSAADDATAWSVAIRVGQAWRMRIRLGDVRLPIEAQMWVYGENGETVGPFGTELQGPDGTLWTPSVGGPEIRLEILVPDSAWESGDAPSLKVEAISELFPLSDAGRPQLGGKVQLKDTSCLEDAACVGTGDWPPIDIVTAAVAYLQYQEGGSGYICTGSLVNDSVPATWVPYLLTANHCFSTQSAASSLEAFFDYIDDTCGGSAPPLATLPRTFGSTLLETRSTSDFTFVRLNQLPSGSRGFLGWTTVEPINGAILYRVSHPMGWPAGYSKSTKVANPSFTCGMSTTNFHFANTIMGGTFGGSSGSALLNGNAQILGQLRSVCGQDPSDGCDYSNYDLDGKFSVTFPWISQYIGGGGSDCVPNLENGVVCLRDGRFEFTATWTDFANPAVTRPLIWTPVEDINATGGFQNNPSGIQIVMRVADGCSLTGTWWIWLGGFTDAGWNIRVRDTVTRKQRDFDKPRQGGVFPKTVRDWTTFTCN